VLQKLEVRSYTGLPQAGHVGIMQAGTVESNSANIRSALARGLPELVPAPCSHDGTFVVVGSGFSVTGFLDEIREEQQKGRPICAVKGTHDWLLDNGVTPNLFVSVEPRSRPLRHVSQDTIYLLASRCSQDLFDQLKDAKVILWHSWSPEKECDEFLKLKKFAIGGGPTSGLRAINLGYVLGFRKFVLYGFDSCLAPDQDTKRFTGEKVGGAMKLDVWVNGKRFWCNGALADQANQFQELYKAMGDITIEAKGDGLIANIIAQRKRMGMRT